MKIATHFLRSNDSFISSPHIIGPAESRNVGVSLARGQWICFLDDDDSFDSNYFENFIKTPKEADKIYFGNYSKLHETRDNNGISIQNSEQILIAEKSSDEIYIGNFIPINTIFIPRNTAKQYSFDINLESHEDWDYLICLKYNNHEILGLPNLTGANVHFSQDKSRNKNNSISLDFLSIYRKWPSSNSMIQNARAIVLNQWGLNIPELFL